MQWTRADTLVLARNSCCFCYGLGLRPGRDEQETVCNCVLREIFRQCYARFRECDAKEKYVAKVSLEANPGRLQKNTWGLKNEEYMADFCLIAWRTLAEEEQKLAIFKYHFLLGASWEACCRKTGLKRGLFFHEVYRIQQMLGRAYRETEPYPLFPLDQYFNSRITDGEPEKAQEPLKCRVA